jgi:hypothetical protein
MGTRPRNFKKNIFFAECHNREHSAKIFLKNYFSLPSAMQRDTRQSFKKMKTFFAKCPAERHSA